MPGSGKSTMAKFLSSQTPLSFYDLDLEIEKNEGKNVNKIFKEKSENYFREIET